MRFSIILPVLNEEAIIATQLRLLREECAQHDCEILVVDGGSEDQTMERARPYGQIIQASRGRARQMNAGAKVAQGEILLFLHADTVLPRNALDKIEQALQRPEVVGGAFRLRFQGERRVYRLIAFCTNLRSRLLQIYTGDQGYFMRARSFREIGGYPDQELMEDLEITIHLRQRGIFVFLPEYVRTSARRHEQVGLLRSILLMWWLRTLYQLGVSPGRLRQIYTDIR